MHQKSVTTEGELEINVYQSKNHRRSNRISPHLVSFKFRTTLTISGCRIKSWLEDEQQSRGMSRSRWAGRWFPPIAALLSDSSALLFSQFHSTKICSFLCLRQSKHSGFWFETDRLFFECSLVDRSVSFWRPSVWWTRRRIEELESLRSHQKPTNKTLREPKAKLDPHPQWSETTDSMLHCTILYGIHWSLDCLRTLRAMH